MFALLLLLLMVRQAKEEGRYRCNNRRWIRWLSRRREFCIDIGRIIRGSWTLDVFAASKTRGCPMCGSPDMRKCTATHCSYGESSKLLSGRYQWASRDIDVVTKSIHGHRGTGWRLRRNLWNLNLFKSNTHI